MLSQKIFGLHVQMTSLIRYKFISQSAKSLDLKTKSSSNNSRLLGILIINKLLYFIYYVILYFNTLSILF
jgi:hypothetical protein